MFVVSGGRRTGKTSFLIWKSAFTGIPILVLSEQQRRLLLHQAHSMNLKIPMPIVWTSRRPDGYTAGKVFIDEAQYWINMVLRERMGAELEGMTGDFRVGELRPFTYEIDKTDTVFKVGENQWNMSRAALYGNFVQKEESGAAADGK